ncbi:MAG: PIG-L family deacetylase [Actinomycetota bacterium]|nr:PIG-L family deacetylase [Actinomycetota bacterium]MDQ2955339.1 PIG-L family deacetylase [Actinomycetota bacterium]
MRQDEPDRLIAGTGTPASVWRESAGWRAMPLVQPAELVPPGFRLVVLAPHPDDEVLGAGGLLRMTARHGRDLLVVAVTDGAGSHPNSTRWPSDLLLEQRPAETVQALTVLGVPRDKIRRLALPDGAIAANSVQLQDRLLELLGPADVVIAPWQWDGHPDHEAVGRAGQAAAREVDARYLEMPIWGWHWAHPEHPAFPWHRAVGVGLGEAADAKRRAVQAFASQLQPDPSTGAEPILPDWALDRMVGDREVFLR